MMVFEEPESELGEVYEGLYEGIAVAQYTWVVHALRRSIGHANPGSSNFLNRFSLPPHSPCHGRDLGSGVIELMVIECLFRG